MKIVSVDGMNENKLIKSINWIITNKCNSRCTHCDIWQNEDENELDINDIKKILNDEIVRRSYEKYKKSFDISLGGGEPFLRQDLQEIVDLIEKRFPDSFKAISTNGLLTRRILRFLNQNRDLKLKLNISLDGIGKTHDKIRGLDGAFNRTVYTILQIRRLFPDQEIEIKLTLLPQNYNQILAVYRLSTRLKCDFSFKPAEDMQNYTNKVKSLNLKFTKAQLCKIRNQSFKIADMMYERGDYKKSRFSRDIPFYLANKKRPSACSVPKEHLTIMPNGDSFFCIKEAKSGNIMEKPIKGMKRMAKNFKCKSCMLMCGSFKDYTDEFFEMKTANIETTLNCNLNCKMCTQRELRNFVEPDMSIIKFEEIMEKHKDITHVSFVGGEPFLNKDFFKMMDYLDIKGVTYEVTTNGTLVDLNTLKKLKDCIGLKKINFSLDGLRQYHDKERGPGVFDKCASALEAAKDFFDVNVCTVVKKDNIKEIPKLCEDLAGKGIKNQKLIYGMNLSKKAREESQKIIPKLKIQGPKLDNQVKDYTVLIKLFNSLEKISKENKIKINFEPDAMQSNPKSFLERDLVKDKEIQCKQLNQLRFNSAGERIICEFIRNPFGLEVSRRLKSNLLPICNDCCKLENVYIKKINHIDKNRKKLTINSLNLLESFIFSDQKGTGETPPFFINLMLEPTNRCNLRCPTCFSHQDGREKKDMSFGDFKKIIDKNIDVINNLSLYNYGEPLLNKYIYKMIRYAKEKGAKHIKLATNGMQLSKENINSLLNSNLDYLSISLDGATPETYSKFRIGGDFDLVVDNTKKLVQRRNEAKSKMKIEIQFIIMEHNKHEIRKIEKLARNLGADYLRLKKVLIKREKWKDLLPTEKKYSRYHQNTPESHTCHKPLNELVINSDGTVIPCCYVVGKDIDKFNLGSIFDKSLEEILKSDKYKQFIKNCLRRKEDNSCCIGCNEGNLKLDYQVIDLNK